MDALSFDGNWKYLLMGSGTADEIEKIKRKIKEKHLENRIVLTGYIDISEMPKYWNAIDCAIHFPVSTPKWIETFSLALVQAMATGCCVIGSDSGSVPYQVGENGIVVHEGDSDCLSKTMNELMKNKDLQKNNSLAMRQRAKDFFSVKSLNKQFYDLIMELKNER